MSADEYPAIPDYDSGDNFTMEQALLKNMINQTIYAVAVTDNKPILTGELFDISNYNFNLVAIDGFRLAVRTEKLDTDNHYHFVVKSKALSEVSKLLKDDDDMKVTVHVSKKHVTFEISGYMVISRLLEGEFHNYKGSIPSNHSTEIFLNTKDLIGSLERCMLLINDKNKAPVKCIFNNGQVKISCSTSIGKLSDEFDIDLTGPMVEIGFNCRYLLDALKASESDKVKLQLNGGLSPMKILPMEGDAYTFLVLPVRLKAD
jgi:DNA polymerase-3 subunit beta